MFQDPDHFAALVGSRNGGANIRFLAKYAGFIEFLEFLNFTCSSRLRFNLKNIASYVHLTH